MVRVYQDSFYRLKQIIGDKQGYPANSAGFSINLGLALNPASSQSPLSSRKRLPFRGSGSLKLFDQPQSKYRTISEGKGDAE